jgi:hypothetical protein
MLIAYDTPPRYSSHLRLNPDVTMLQWSPFACQGTTIVGRRCRIKKGATQWLVALFAKGHCGLGDLNSNILSLLRSLQDRVLLYALKICRSPTHLSRTLQRKRIHYGILPASVLIALDLCTHLPPHTVKTRISCGNRQYDQSRIFSSRYDE